MEMNLLVMEGVESTWHYHLGKGGAEALCGAKVMPTQIPISAWDKTPPNYHIPESWCKTCALMRATMWSPACSVREVKGE